MAVKMLKRVQVNGINPAMMFPIIAAGQFDALHAEGRVYLTSATDGKHSVNSLHYAGAAVDFDVSGEEGKNAQLAEYLADHLTGDYDVINEVTHVHVEYQPRYRG